MATRVCVRVGDRAVHAALGTHTALRLLADDARRLPAVALVAAIVEAVAELPRRASRVALALPVSWCYVHPFRVGQRRPARTLLAFALEEFLPVEIETLTCEFVALGGGGYLGLALETARLREITRGLEASGIDVDHIALDPLNRNARLPGERLLWCDRDHAALLTFGTRGLIALRVLRCVDSASLDRALEDLLGTANAAPGSIRLGGWLAGDALPERCRDLPLAPHSGTAHRMQLDFARDALAPVGRQTATWRAARSAAAAALVALLLVAAGLGGSQGRYRAELTHVRAAELSLFGQLYPAGTPPRSVSRWLASERRRLSAAGTLLAESSDDPDALWLLRDIIAAVPPDLCLDLQELRIERDSLLIRGHTRDHRSAELLASRLDALESLACPPPRTDRLEGGGVSFVLNGHADSLAARRSEPSSGAARGARQ